MPKSTRLRLPDVRALLQIVGECRDLGDDPVAWRQHFAGGIARLTGADMVTVGTALGGRDGTLQHGGVGVGGCRTSTRACWPRTWPRKGMT